MTTIIRTYAGAEQVDTFHDEGGLTVTRALGFKSSVKRYVITHKASGYAVGDEVIGTSLITRTFKSTKVALEGLQAILPLADWTRTASEVASISLEATRVLAELAKDEHTLRMLPPKR